MPLEKKYTIREKQIKVKPNVLQLQTFEFMTVIAHTYNNKLK